MPDTRPVVRIPSHGFFYTIDQIALILSVEESWLTGHIYFSGRMPDAHHRSKLLATNMAKEGAHPRWRISERDFIIWLKRRGFKAQFT